MIVGQRSVSAFVLMAGVLILASCAASRGAPTPASDGVVDSSTEVASTPPSTPFDKGQTARGTSGSLGPCPGDLTTIIEAESSGAVTQLTSLDGTDGALLAAFPSTPVCGVDVTEIDRVGRYFFWQDGNIDGVAAALHAAGYVGDLDPGTAGDRFGIFKSGSKQVFLTDQFGAGGTPLPVGSYVVAYRSE